MSVYLLATLDTKWREAALVRDRLVELDVPVTLVDTGCQGKLPEDVTADVTREQVFAAAKTTLADMQKLNDRNEAAAKAGAGAAALAMKAHAKGKLQGVLAIGGRTGATIGTAVMRALPLGVPKVMITPMASGNTRAFVGDKDIVMLNSVVALSGLNRITRSVLLEGAAAMAGMVRHHASEDDARESDDAHDKPLIAATICEATAACVDVARVLVEQAGFTVLLFRADGGGQAMEGLIRDNLIVGVLDMTTGELANDAGGEFSAGASRLTAAAAMGVPQVVGVGALDMMRFPSNAPLPENLRERPSHPLDPATIAIRTSTDECKKIGKDLGKKLAKSKGPVLIMLPKQGISALDHHGQPFDDPAARRALFEAIYGSCGRCEVVELENHINDREFAEAAARRLIQMVTVAV